MMSPSTIRKAESMIQSSESSDLKTLLRSRVPIIVVESREELRFLELVKRVAFELKQTVYQWTVARGLTVLGASGGDDSSLEPTEILRHIWSLKMPGIFLLLDFHPYLSDPRNTRLLKEIAQNAERYRETIVLLSHHLEVPEELRLHVAKLDLQLPDESAIEAIVDQVVARVSSGVPRRAVRIDEEAKRLLIKNLSGLTMAEAQRLARQSVEDDLAISLGDIPRVARAKYELLNRDGVLFYEPETAELKDLGGARYLKKWLAQRREIFVGERAAQGLDIPKGILLLGVQGSGKSLAARCVAGSWHVPLLRLDFGALYDKFYGETERRTRDSLKTAESMAPCVLWFDEIEKGIASRDSDSGTSHRVLGTLLTWLAERKSRVFIVATANEIAMLPPELLRKGRLDEIFFVDLPVAEVRKEIFAIHLKKRGLDPESFDLNMLAKITEGFSGAEIEQAIVSGLYSLTGGVGNLDNDLLRDEIRETRPLSVIMAEEVNAMREWARDRTVQADVPRSPGNAMSSSEN
jgi:hypothetical protein